MTPITTIVHFSVPTANIDEFLSSWREYQEEMNKQPGLIGGVFHRCIDPDGPFQLINVARWESAEALESALQAAGEAMGQKGVDTAAILENLGVRISQNNYVEELRY